MARCGCNTAMSTTCEAIMSCVATALGPGLDRNEQTGNLELRVSGDGDNAARIGSDGGLWAPEPSGEPTPRQWPRTVAGLPERAIGGIGGGNLVGPSTSPQLVEYALASNVDVYSVGCYALADEVAFEYVGESGTDISTYTDNPGGITYGDLASVQLPMLSYDAGTRVSPTGRFSGAPSQFQEPPGGWAGYYSHPYRARTVAAMLRHIRGRAVAGLRLQRNRSVADSFRDVRATVRAVVEAGAQDWAIIYVNPQTDAGTRTPLADLVQIVTAAGIAAGVNIFREDEIDEPFEPAEVVATGAQWVALASPERSPGGMSVERIMAFVLAGLEVEAHTGGRQIWTETMFAVGARTVTSADPVYARGGRGEPGDLDYRQRFVPGLATGTTAVGALTSVTDQRTAVFNSGFARRDEPGRWFPGGYGRVGDFEQWNSHQLLGTICPIPDTTNYRIKLRVWAPSRSGWGSVEFAGIFFGAVADYDIAGLGNPGAEGYAAVVHPPLGGADRMEILRYDQGWDTAIAQSTGGPGWSFATWIDLSVTVQGGQITFVASDGATSQSVAAVDSTYRGAYAYHVWYKTLSGDYYHGYDNPTDLVMYEPLS